MQLQIPTWKNVTRSKNSIKVLGIEVNKQSYNTFMWTIVAGLIAVLALGFLVFKRNMAITHNTKKELQDLKNEFEAYRKTPGKHVKKCQWLISWNFKS